MSYWSLYFLNSSTICQELLALGLRGGVLHVLRVLQVALLHHVAERRAQAVLSMMAFSPAASCGLFLRIATARLPPVAPPPCRARSGS